MTTDRAAAAVLPAMATQDNGNADAQPPTIPFAASTPVFVPAVLHAWPHDSTAFTQGLAFSAGRLYESTGLEGRSQVRELDPRTLVVRHRVTLPAAEFGEGIAVSVRDSIR